MKTFIAVLISTSSSDDPEYREMIEETFCLIHASSLPEARAAAEKMGEGSSVEFRNREGQLIRWSFSHVADVREALYEDLSVNTELYSRHFRAGEGAKLGSESADEAGLGEVSG